jgi:[NiFe] hydrogenase diaphorase moiety large subunit
VTNGYLDQPTIVNNVETFAAAAMIALKGGEWYAGIGTRHSAGTKILSVSGDCARPGIYEYPFGVSIRQVLEDCGASDTQAVQVSGPSGICVAENEFDRIIGFEDIPTAGASPFSTRRATCSRWRATTCISSSTKAAASARPAGSAPRC